MSGRREMDLRMRILAEGRQAMAELGRVGAGIKGLADTSRSAGRSARDLFRHVGTGAGIILKPLDLAAKASLGLGVALAGLSYKALDVRADMESLRLRLDGVTASKQEADRAFATAMKLSVASPFTPAQMVETTIGLRNLGLTGVDALTAIGNASALSGRDMGYLTQVLGALSTESLRAIGIEMSKDGDNYTFGFRDRMQRANKIVATGVDDARAKLLKIWDIQYGGGMSKFAESLKGLKSTLKGNIDNAFDSYGQGLETLAKNFLKSLDKRVVDLIKSGRLLELGKKVAAGIEDAIDIGKQLVADPAALRKVLQQTMVFAARAFLEYLSAGRDVLMSLAGMMGAAFMGPVIAMLQHVPGMETVRASILNKTQLPHNVSGETPDEQRERKLAFLSDYQKASRGDNAAFDRITSADYGARFASSMAEIPARVLDAGRNIRGIYGQTIGPALPSARREAPDDLNWTINIQNLEVRANDAGEMGARLQRAAGVPQVSMAGTL